MKNLLFLSLLVSFVGCQKFNRLIDGPKDAPPKPMKAISSIPAIGEAPDFNLQTPAGYTRLVFHGELVGPIVKVNADVNSLVQVFIKERSIGQWFRINDEYSDAFWFTFDPVAGTITYHGKNLGQKEFCVYQYVKVAP